MLCGWRGEQDQARRDSDNKAVEREDVWGHVERRPLSDVGMGWKRRAGCIIISDLHVCSPLGQVMLDSCT